MTKYRVKEKAWSEDRQYSSKPAVHWLAPRELLKSGIRAVISKTFGDYSDRRETFAILQPHPSECDLEKAGLFVEGDESSGDFWFDYVSDVGDGFSATYSIAEAIAKNELEAGGEKLHRGKMLVMGGDEVYPTPSAEEYKDRTVGPYETALQYLYEVGADGEEIDVALSLYAVPGNHDWYDGLSAFIKQFCTRQWIGAWRTRQHRSYFAVKLPRKWWLWGIDIAFDGPIDTAQIGYFEKAAEHLKDGDAIILCTAKPSWIKCPASDDALDDSAYNNLRYMVSETLKDKDAEVRLMLAGDKHHYARYTELNSDEDPVVEGTHKITAGGGGAYLSPTSDLYETIRLRERQRGQPHTLRLENAWPDTASSNALGRRALWRLPSTWGLMAAWGVVYALIINLLRESVSEEAGLTDSIRTLGEEGFGGAFQNLVSGSVTSVAFWIMVIVLLAGTVALANKGHPEAKGKGWMLGILHTIGHLAGAAAVASFGLWLATRPAIGEEQWSLVSVYIATTLLLGAVVGTLVLTIYLIGASYAKRNLNELFTGIRWEGYKNFVRLRIDPQGDLHVRVLGLKKVNRRRLNWVDDKPDVSGDSATVELIDSVTIPRGGS